jgi:tRNA-dihydrouridine synthase
MEGEAQSFAAIDVNLACPVKKIDRKARGGHWLTEPAGAIAILKAVRAAVPPQIPCSVKLRRAYDDTPEMARCFEQVFDGAFEAGYSWATVHARTVEQRYIGPSRWAFLRDLCARKPGAVIFGSGDVWEAADIFRMIAYTGVAAVSVARGAIGNPWIFRQAREMMAGRPPSAPTLMEQRRALKDHFDLSVALHGEKHAGRMMRKFGIKFAQHHPTPEAVKARMVAVNSTADWLSVLDALYPRSDASARIDQPAHAATSGA